MSVRASRPNHPNRSRRDAKGSRRDAFGFRTHVIQAEASFGVLDPEGINISLIDFNAKIAKENSDAKIMKKNFSPSRTSCEKLRFRAELGRLMASPLSSSVYSVSELRALCGQFRFQIPLFGCN